jgi:PTS system N-acetylglucosamine-specific IIC component
LAMTSFLTGVTEPIEFSFMFLAPVLYALHAALTGLSMVVMNLLDVKLGFGFSAGLFDYVLNFNKATRPLLLLPVGLVYGAIYYFTFRFFIVRFDLKTPGREPDDTAATTVAIPTGDRAGDFITALGGAANLVSVDACTTRLRMVVVNQSAVDEAGLKALGARGVIRPSERALQVVLGPVADMVASEIRAAINASPSASGSAVAEQGEAILAVLLEHEQCAQHLIRAVGGAENVETQSVCSSRLRLVLRDEALFDAAALEGVSPRGFARVGDRVLHILLGPEAPAVALALSRSVQSGRGSD